MSDRNEALRLADQLDAMSDSMDMGRPPVNDDRRQSAAALRRLTAEQAVMRQWIADVLPALEGVNLEDALPDFSALVESGRRLVDGGPDDLLNSNDVRKHD